MVKSNLRTSIAAYLFDLDGTLVDTEPMWAAAVWASLEELSCHMQRKETDELVYGHSWLDIYAHLCELFPGAWPDRPALEKRIERHFNKLKTAGGFVFNSSVELLIKLAREKPTAIVSGSSRKTVGQWVEELELGNFIQFYLGCEDYPVGKPDPGCYIMASERLGVRPESCLVFEDSAAGVESAVSAGMYCVALSIKGSRPQNLDKADLIVNDLGDLDCKGFAETPPVLRIK